MLAASQESLLSKAAQLAEHARANREVEHLSHSLPSYMRERILSLKAGDVAVLSWSSYAVKDSLFCS